jgi:hypothetical protein
MIAIKRLQSIFWILVVAAGALATYLIFHRVASERNAVYALDKEIAKARGDIRYLEAEFGSRASLRQLERWNADAFRYGAPQADQFLPGEASLAQLDRIERNGADVAAPPVMVAMVATRADTPAAAIARNPSPAAERVSELAVAPVLAAPATRPVVALRPLPTATKQARPASRPATSRLAMLDQKLLDDAALRRISAKADARTDELAP